VRVESGLAEGLSQGVTQVFALIQQILQIVLADTRVIFYQAENIFILVQPIFDVSIYFGGSLYDYVINLIPKGVH
jgi:hypothetical protein